MAETLPYEVLEAERRQWRWLGGGLATLAMLLAGILYSDRAREIRDQGARLEKTAEIVSKNVERQLAATKVALVDVRRDTDLFTDTRRPVVGKHLAELGRVMPAIAWFAVCDADGQVVTGSAPTIEGASFSSAEFFKRVKQSHAGVDDMIVSSPFRMPDGKVTVAIAMRDVDAAGNLTHVVVAGLDVAYFQLFLETVSFAPDVRAAVVHEDGHPFVQGPPTGNMVVERSMDTTGTLFYTHIHSGRARSIVDGNSAYLHERLLSAWVNIDPPGVDDVPLVAVVYRSWSQILLPWRHQVASASALFAFMTLCLSFGLRSFQLAVRGHVRQQQATLQSEQDAMRSLGLALQAGHIGTFEWELDTNGADDGVATVSEVARSILGLPLDGEMHPSINRNVHPADIEGIRETVGRAAAAGGVITAEWRWYRPSDGHMIWIMMKGRVSPASENGRRRLYGVIVDVSDRMQAKELQERADRAQAASEAKGAFMSHVSHELRTPMNAVLGFAQILSADREGHLSTEQRKQLRLLKQAGRHMASLIDDLLDLSMIEAGRLTVSMETVDACAAAQEVRAVLQPLADEAKVTLNIPQQTVEGKWVHADMLRLRQVLLNLLSNAIKYNRPGGSVTMTMKPLEGTRPPLARVDVVDTGIGMEQDQMDHLFEPFNRLGAQLTAVRGTGIGLSITRSLVAAMGGTIEVTTERGVGSTFSFTLQTASPADAAAARGREEVEPAAETAPMPLDALEPRRPISVLYVEDNPVNVLIVEQVATQRDFVTFSAATSGAEAMRMVEEHRPDLLLVDMHLGDTDGLSLVAALAEAGLIHGTRCVMLSADAGRESKAAARSAGFDAYVTKPIDVKAVLAEFDRTASSI